MSTSNTKDKVLELDALAERCRKLRAEGKRIVHCHGVFDLLHLGHVRHFQAARKNGDVLVVTLTQDAWVNKGPHRPAFGHVLRCEMLANLECVDYVAVNRWPTAVPTIDLLRPHIYAKGSDYADESKDVTGGIRREREAVESVGGKILFTNEATFSSSTLINRHMPVLSEAARDFIDSLSATHTCDDVVAMLEGLADLRVVVCGETIIDEYNYCETLGVSGKEPILAVRRRSTEQFAGGVIAVANHLAGFCHEVTMVTFLGGDNEPREDYVRKHLQPGVTPVFLEMPSGPTITKRRFIEEYPFQKLFEVYEMNEDAVGSRETSELVASLEQLLPNHDLAIVTDYGHGMLGQDAVRALAEHASFLAVNTQANAGNHGFNTVSKYPRADYICMSERELRLEARLRHADIREIMQDVSERLGCRDMLITRGEQGILSLRRPDEFVISPALADHFRDRVGAGDAVFAITSLCAARKAPLPILGLVGNLAGALAVNIVGNREPIGRAQLVKSLVSLFR